MRRWLERYLDPSDSPDTIGCVTPTAVQRIAPGLAVAIAVACAARLGHGALPDGAARAVGEVILAVAGGLVVGNVVRLPAGTAPGIRFAFQGVLRAAIVLLGSGLSFAAVAATGARALLAVVALMVLALIVAHGVGRRLGVPPRLATLLGVGAAVCGNSAIGAVAPVIGADDDEVAYAIATNTLLGTLAVFAYPLLGRALGLSDAEFGTWAGTAIHDTSQVVAAGFAYSVAAGEVSTVVKLTRNALIGAVVLAVGWFHGGARSSGPRGAVPWFVIGFLTMAVIRTLGGIAWLSEATHVDVGAVLTWTSRALILVALAGVGLSTRVAELRRSGLAPLGLGLTIALAIASASFAWIRFVGPAAP